MGAKHQEARNVAAEVFVQAVTRHMTEKQLVGVSVHELLAVSALRLVPQLLRQHAVHARVQLRRVVGHHEVALQ